MTVLQCQNQTAGPVSNLPELKLPQIWERKINQIANEHRMNYQLYAETASSYEELKASLKNKGYFSLPIGPSPLLRMDGYSQAPVAETESLDSTKIMIQKK